jgi:uncharacterized protein (DUF2336 family)
MHFAQTSLIEQLESAVKQGSSEKRVNTLRQITGLFMETAEKLNEEQVKVFDDVLLILIDTIESKVLAEISRCLAPLDAAPVKVIKRLASHDEISVAAPVLAASPRLSADDLAEIALSKSQAHLMAIAGRTRLEETVTDALLARGDRDVVLRLAENSGACFSASGYTTLVKKAQSDERLAEGVGVRFDLPLPLLRELMERATDAVRSRLLLRAPAEARENIQRVLAIVAAKISNETAKPRDFADAEHLLLAMRSSGQLDDAAVLEFATAKKFEEMTVALALLCSLPIDTMAKVMAGLRNDTVVLCCKAAGLTWPTVEAILLNRYGKRRITPVVIEIARNDFTTLSLSTAQRALRFMRVREIAQ